MFKQNLINMKLLLRLVVYVGANADDQHNMNFVAVALKKWGGKNPKRTKTKLKLIVWPFSYEETAHLTVFVF